MENPSEKWKARAVLVVIANLILGMGVALLRLAGFGTDPFTCMNLGVSSHLPIGYGTYQMILNVALFIPVFILDRKSFGVGALVNMLALGCFVEMVMLGFALVQVAPQGLEGNFALRAAILATGVLVVCFGIALYMVCDLGSAPYDRLGVIIENYTHHKVKFKWARVCLDLISMGIGFATGSVVGVGTIIIAFFTGPVVSFFRDTIVARIMRRL